MKIYPSTLQKYIKLLRIFKYLIPSLISPPANCSEIRQQVTSVVGKLPNPRWEEYLTDTDVGKIIRPFTHKTTALLSGAIVVIKKKTKRLVYAIGDLQINTPVNPNNISLINKEAALLHHITNRRSYNLRKGQQIFAQYV